MKRQWAAAAAAAALTPVQLHRISNTLTIFTFYSEICRTHCNIYYIAFFKCVRYQG